MTVGVAVALYNGERFIEKQLDTIRLQSRKADRVVLCDDGSKDNTVAAVSAYIDKYSLHDNWSLICNPQNLGYIKNFYGAIGLCDTDIVFLCDQDDVWKEDKIEKMLQIMEEQPQINLLSCRYGIVDANGQQINSVVDRKANESGSICAVCVEDIMTAYRWPGMVMCIRKDFFNEIAACIYNCDVAHDFMFAVLSADKGSFYEYDYIGAFHRRHDNNTAREEHRISKLLNMQRKLKDIAVTQTLWNNFLSANLPVDPTTRKTVARRVDLLNMRKEALEGKNLIGVLKLYFGNWKLLRLNSFVCDVWLALFG